MNSRVPNGKGSKTPITRDNMEDIFGFFAEAKEYILHLEKDGDPLCKTRR